MKEARESVRHQALFGVASIEEETIFTQDFCRRKRLGPSIPRVAFLPVASTSDETPPVAHAKTSGKQSRQRQLLFRKE